MNTSHILNLNENDKEFLNGVIYFIKIIQDQLYNQDIIKTQYKFLDAKFNMPISEVCCKIHLDIQCLFNFYKSDNYGLIDLYPNLTLNEKIDIIKSRTNDLLNSKPTVCYQNLFKQYTRWIDFNGMRNEVRIVLDKGWDGIIYQDVNNKDIFYLNDLEWCNGAYVDRIRLISSLDLEILKNNKSKI